MSTENKPGRIGLTALGSGSSGNAFVLHAPGGNYLIDAGFSRKELCVRMKNCNIDPESIRAVLITHEHTDHVQGCRVFCNSFDIPLYISGGTLEALARKSKLPEKVVVFSPDSPFELPGVSVNPFSVSHDAADPVGFNFTLDQCRIALATDLGRMEKKVEKALYNADILVLEANYDLKMLMESKREMSLKRRIMGSAGHLDNRTAAAALPALLGPRTRTLLLAHISSECNDHRLLSEIITRQLNDIARGDVEWRLLHQDHPDSGCFAQQ